MVTLLNTSIITTYGTYEYLPIDLSQAQQMVVDGPWQSAIGHDATAEMLTELFGLPIPVNRINYQQQVGDRAIVFKLRGRIQEGAILSRSHLEEIGYDFGLLIRRK